MKLLKTKLSKPPINITTIERMAILERFADYNQYKMLLVSAPAGSGKSTLINTWLDRVETNYCWYSLDVSDNDLKQYLTYLITCIETHDIYLPFQLSDLLFSLQSIGSHGFIHALINILYECKEPLILVFDDYHLIQNTEIHQMMKLFVEHIPPHVHLVLITREDPPLSLSKLRVSRFLLEIRYTDLQFNDEEITRFLINTMGLRVDPRDIQTLNYKTEGWIAGIQLAALSIQNHDDPRKLIDEISGNHYIVDYLMEEVLSYMDQELLDFLLATSILSQFTAKLCDDMLSLESGTSETYLSMLSQSNTFIIPLDQTQNWFRYHHLFKELLLSRLATNSIDVKKRHLRASLWFEKEDHIDLAIYHALKAEALDIAADFIENIWAECDRSMEASRWLEKFKQLPLDIVKKRPVLLAGYSWALLDIGRHEEALVWLKEAEDLYQGIQSGDISDYRISDKEQYDILASTIASAYCFISIGQGRFDEMFAFAHEAFQKNPEISPHRSGVLHMLMGLALWAIGDLPKARQEIDQAIIEIQKHESHNNLGTYELVHIELQLDIGNFEQTKHMLDKVIFKALNDTQIPLSMANFYLDYSRLHLAQGNLQEAINAHITSKTYGKKYCLPDFWYKWYQQQANLQICQGLYDSALLSLDEAEVNYYLNPLPTRTTIKGLRGYIYILLEQYNHAGTCFDKPYAEQDLIYQSIYLAKIERQKEAESILNELYSTAMSQHRGRTVTEVLLGKSILALVAGDHAQCVQSLVESQKYINEWCYIEPLLRYKDVLGGIYSSLKLADKLKAKISVESLDASYTVFQVNQKLPEPLTPRELDVLQLLANGYSNQDVCNELFLAISTVKGYNQNLFGKLGVRRRTEAILKARMLGLIK
jgi:LuxR family maltose regulon positive regulatory protein